MSILEMVRLFKEEKAQREAAQKYNIDTVIELMHEVVNRYPTVKVKTTANCVLKIDYLEDNLFLATFEGNNITVKGHSRSVHALSSLIAKELAEYL